MVVANIFQKVLHLLNGEKNSIQRYYGVSICLSTIKLHADVTPFNLSFF